jgi:demethylmenaquinone methyltransferase/2-methoxy-6-polyprenyl-1,4-benzoquinol methylase
MMDEIPTDNPTRIRAMFAGIARRYDLNNRLHSLGLDVRWRRRAVRAGGPAADRRVLDAACGAGAMAAEWLRAGAAEVVALDFCPEMLAVGARRLGDGGGRLRWRRGDVTALPLADATFDIASMGFGLRNVPDRPAALAELRRVLRPGGRLVVLEFAGGAPSGWVHRLLRWQMRRVMPHTAGRLAGGRPEAYRYLDRSVRGFPTPEALGGELAAAGFADVRIRRLSFGLTAIHLARRV